MTNLLMNDRTNEVSTGNFQVDGQMVGMVKMAVHEYVYPILEKVTVLEQDIKEKDQKIEMLNEQIRDLTEGQMRIEQGLVLIEDATNKASKTELIGKTVEIDLDKFKAFKEKYSSLPYKEKSSMIRKFAWKIYQSVPNPQSRGDGYTKLYDTFAKVAGYHPYDTGKERRNGGKSGKSYLGTVDNRGDIDLLLFIAKEMAGK